MKSILVKLCNSFLQVRILCDMLKIEIYFKPLFTEYVFVYMIKPPDSIPFIPSPPLSAARLQHAIVHEDNGVGSDGLCSDGHY